MFVKEKDICSINPNDQFCQRSAAMLIWMEHFVLYLCTQNHVSATFTTFQFLLIYFFNYILFKTTTAVIRIMEN